MRTTPKILIGIDPDVQKSGVAVYDVDSKKIVIISDFKLHELFYFLSRLTEIAQHEPIKVYLEAGYTVKKHWQKKGHGVAKSVGENQGICKAIEAYLQDMNIPYELLPPAGYSKYTHEAFCKITGWDVAEKTNPEKRAAGMIVWGRKK